MNSEPTDDDIWQRPGPDSGSDGNPGAQARYAGPPPITPPEPAWHPPLVARPSPPRRLPELDEAAVDADEAHARRFTLGVGIAAAVILLAVAVAHLLG